MPSAVEKIDPKTTREAIAMLHEYDDDEIEIGRINEGMDPSEFDAFPPKLSEIDSTDASYLAGEDAAAATRSPAEGDLKRMMSEDAIMVFAGEAVPFRSPGAEAFPILKSALRHFQRAATRPRAVRVDTPETYLGFAADQALKEIDRRLRELRAVVEEHASDGHGGEVPPMSKWEVLGAMRAVEDLRGADSARDAVEKLEQVPLDLPGYARGKVHCWQDGDCVICSLHFAAADGSHRVATGTARPSADADEAAAAAVRAGVDPVTVLGVLPDLAAVAAGKRLVREVAGVALKARKHSDVLGADGPVVVVRGAAGSAPLAAVMHLQQRAERGDAGARREMALLEQVAQTRPGKRLAAPVLREARRRLTEGRQKRALGTGIMSAYARAAGWV